MTETYYWNVFIFDDDQEILDNLKEILNDEVIPGTTEKIRIKTCNDFELTLLEFEKRRIDLAIVDVKQGKPIIGVESGTEAGENILKRIREKKFIPVIFFTAWPRIVRHLEGQYVKIIEKTQDPSILIQTIKTILDSQLPSINRALTAHMEKVQADYMWGFVSDNWNRFEGVNPYELAYILARRMSLSLSDEGVKSFLKESGAPKEFYEAGSLIHPMQYYVIPPVEPIPRSGDLFFGKIDNVESHWCLLTPSCDLIPYKGKIKAEWILFAKCVPLTDQPEYTNWQRELSTTKNVNNKHFDHLLAILTNNRKANTQPERYFFLPSVLSTPDLIIDFQQLKIVKPEIFAKGDILKRIASIDPPFSDSIISKFSRYFGRVGTPNLNCSCVISKYVKE